MSDAGRTGVPTNPGRHPIAVRINALQTAWLREIGVPRAMLPTADQAAPERVQPAASERVQPAAPMPAVSQAKAQVIDTVQRDVGASAKTEDANSSQPAPVAARPARTGTGAGARPQPIQQLQDFVPLPRNAADIEQADLESLRLQVDACGACGLYTSRQHAVFGSGPQQAEWMIVGEAPGEQEDVQALPFVGKSGALLTEMLRAVGVDRNSGVYISNVIKCRPPGNRNPRPEEIEACKPFLLRQIQLIRPARLLVVGRFAAQVLLGSDANLNALRGRVHVFDDGQGRKIPLVVSYHPAYLLRSPQEKARAWRDLMLAARHEQEDVEGGITAA